ncbi:conserved hypothetical protein [Leishmania infantum JPCM5]|uniref:Zinc finger PHD-type domain-containing protein n=2 Tax=Leishmania infantum TaxID=5671 RepID=A4I0W1_LEIIN|nr:conserved hypothetical protein [Leishmania infantum JPCM5]CAC9491786.1 hypothetical_protein_-_conserved [Leishmania infantum]CAM68385.2 conserved hypothetical protein [Leishmania infantum JPCM5]SUZ42206.1 hypothetical_protein_-_conserved [Leishmania infantum]|eukprot:XP_001465952.2 conserved hypothetical protein [Leishmania infantum JPCM5]
MPRGRSHGRGRGGRGRGAAGAPEDDPGDEIVTSSPRPLDAEAVVTVLSTMRGRGARGRGRGRGRLGRGSTTGGARGERGRGAVSLQSVSGTSEASKSMSAVSPSTSPARSTLEASPLSASPAAPVVVVVPQGRMITRSLLRSTASLLLDNDSDAAGSPLVLPLNGRRRRRTESAAANASSFSPNLPVPRDDTLGSSALASTRISSASLPASAMADDTAATADSSGSRLSPLSQRVVIGGLLRCVCNAFLVSPSETLLECCRCRNWCHSACVGVDYEELRLRQRQRDFLCPFCTETATPASAPTGASSTAADSLPTEPRAFSAPPLPPPGSQKPASITTSLGESIKVLCSPTAAVVTAVNGLAVAQTGGSSGRGDSTVAATSALPVLPPTSTSGSSLSSYPLVSRQPPAPRQLPLKLREVPDRSPPAPLADELRRLIRMIEHTAHQLGYNMLHLPAHTLTEQQVTECLGCCAEAIQDATFSADYPAYCLKEVQNRRHPYVQGIALQSQANGRICSLILSSGRDLYGNLKPTITQLKSSLQRGLLEPSALTPFMAECMAIADVADFVHITLSATHAQHQRKGLARLLMTMELLKWSLRGRHRAFLNMAIEKRLVDGGSRIEFASPAASKRLYESFGFAEVYPRYDPVTRKERWTAKEADMGRVMANLNFVDHVRAVAEAIPAKHNVSGSPNGDGVGHGGGKGMGESAEERSSIASRNETSRSRSGWRAGNTRKRGGSAVSNGGDDSDSGQRNGDWSCTKNDAGK